MGNMQTIELKNVHILLFVFNAWQKKNPPTSLFLFPSDVNIVFLMYFHYLKALRCLKHCLMLAEKRAYFKKQKYNKIIILIIFSNIL